LNNGDEKSIEDSLAWRRNPHGDSHEAVGNQTTLLGLRLALFSLWLSGKHARKGFELPVELKTCSFGRLDGKIVAVDYGGCGRDGRTSKLVDQFIALKENDTRGSVTR